MIAILHLALALTAFGGDDFPAATIPAALRDGASSVVRLDEQQFIVKNPREATHKVRRVVTVLDEAGKDEAVAVVFYDTRLGKLKSFSGKLRDADGRVVRSLGKDDQIDRSAISGYSLYEASRVHVGRLEHPTYPYTVEFSYETQSDGLINWPSWSPQEENQGVEQASYTLTVPADLGFRQTVRNGTLTPAEQTSGGKRTLRWTVANLAPLPDEPSSPSWSDRALTLLVAPNVFEIEDHTGRMDTWAGFGEWLDGLSYGRDVLPPATLAEVQRRTAGETTATGKARQLYTYLQETTRYVSIQLGIGGWQPFDATYVATRGYGDCKALTNYLQSMLKAVGVQAYPAFIKAGRGVPDIVTDFSSNQFNHVILCLPTADGGRRDTTWLECTSQTAPFGQLGTFTEGRHALVLLPGGARLVATPTTTPDRNSQHRRATVTLAASGDATAAVVTRYAGSQADQVRDELVNATPVERDTWLRRQIDTPGLQLVKADFSAVEGRDPVIELPVEVRLGRIAPRTGARIFLKPNLFNRWGAVPAPMPKRTQPVRRSVGWVDSDSVQIALPAGFALEAVPDPVHLDSPFGVYDARATVADGVLTYTRRLEMRAGDHPASAYADYRSFVQGIVKADGAQAVLVPR